MNVKYLNRLLVVGLVLVLVQPALAWQQTGKRIGLHAMVGHAALHAELKLTEDQKKSLVDWSAKGRAKQAEINQLDAGDAKQKAYGTLYQSTIETLGKVLEKKQLKRFHEIRRQQNLQPGFFSQKQFVKRLKLTEEQQAKVADQVKATNKELEAIDVEKKGQLANKRRQVLAKGYHAALKILTEDQQKQWKTIVGKPFSFQ